MNLIDRVPIARRKMILFFLIDTSGSMSGKKIQSVNDAIENVLPIIGEISDENPDAEINIAAMKFSTGVDWVYNEPKEAKDFIWQPVSPEALTSLGEACRELSRKLSRTNGFMPTSTGSGYYAPAIILLSDGGPTDDFPGGLKVLKENSWFKNAIKVAIAIGDDADKDVLTKFTGTNEAVFTVHNIDALKQIIRVVAVTSSQIGSKSSTAGDTTKQEQVIAEVKSAVDNIGGAEVASAPATTASYDDWD
jgi:uncharacterized protein YegL